jgi:DNA-directed RNA polymerase II subunit RPB2
MTLQDQIANTGEYSYKAEIYIGGIKGDKISIGTPTVSLQNTQEVRLLLPNEARLRNLTYASLVTADVYIRVTFTRQRSSAEGPGFIQTVVDMDPTMEKYSYLAGIPLFKIPIMLHSRYCVLHGKPEEFTKEAGECIYDYGGYFIIDGSEKVLITQQEQAFNTLYIQNQEREPQISTYGTISCLSPTTRQVRRIAFAILRRQGTLQVTIPFVRKPVPVFVLFRALGIQADEDIMRLIFPDPDDSEAELLAPMLQESIAEAFPFLDTYSAIQYIKVLTKGFSEAHVLDILHNQLFVHVEDRPLARAFFLAECVRKILRVAAGIDPKTDRDDTRNQRCLTSGFLTRMLFQGVYTSWTKAASRAIDEEYNYNDSIYKGDNFLNLFGAGNLFRNSKRTDVNAQPDKFLTAGIMRGFKGKWGSGSGDEKQGVLQALSRLSYMDFLSHCRRVVLDFDTGMKLQGPRRLHTSQFGYYCTNETPGGASIGITKNLSNLSTISTNTDPAPFISWLLTRGGVIPCEQITPAIAAKAVPVFVNAGIIGYTMRPTILRDVAKRMKWTGCLPVSTSIAFHIREKRLLFYLDEGRPIRPLIHLGAQGAIPVASIQSADTWRNLIMGKYKSTIDRSLASSVFIDPLASVESPTLEAYKTELEPFCGVIEYVDPYEANESFVACFPEHVQKDTSHLEIHPSTMFGLMTSVIPYANHNQSPRNQLSCSQSKQGVSVYATNFPNRFDNQVHVLCYGEAPLVRTLYYDYVANGQMAYGQNLVLAMGCFSGYNQEDGIVMNADAVQRGMFNSVSYRSYETFEEDDPLSHTSTRIGNPAKTPIWLNLKPGLDYSKLDERGIIREGEYVDENTVLVGRYIQAPGGEIRDASLTAQVWTTGRVEKVAVMVSNANLALVKVRIVQYRVPELGDKFCLTDDHDVMTTRGWVPISEVTTEDFVATLEGDKMAYTQPKETFVFDHTGDMYEMETPTVNLCTTMNHRMYVKRKARYFFELIETKEIVGKTTLFSCAAATSLPDYSFTAEDGTVYEGETMNSLLLSLAASIAEGDLTAVDGNGLFNPWNLSEAQSKTLLSLCGTVIENVDAAASDKLQTLIQHAGWSSTYTKATSTLIINQQNDNNVKTPEDETIVKFDGKVYCISVPSEVFLVRRGGKIVWTGNSNRHGQKGTIGMLIRGHDMPRSESGLVPDMIMNSHAIPSRMTIAQLLEGLLGKCSALAGAIGNATSFMNEGSPADAIGKVLMNQFGMQPMGEELLYDGTTGVMIPSTIFMGNVYTMRLKHMTEDKWNARAEGRREQRTHQPTGGRGNQGGLRMGEMERDAVLGHGITTFVHESYMKRADGTEMVYCNGCGTIPIYNEKKNIYICSLCDGPVKYMGDNASNLELLPPTKRSLVSFSKVEIPYAFKLLDQELSTYMNIGMRVLTSHDLQKLEAPGLRELSAEETEAALKRELPRRVLIDTQVPEFVKPEEEVAVSTEDLSALSALPAIPREEMEMEQEEQQAPQPQQVQEAELEAELLEEEPLLEEAPPLQLAPAPTGPYMVIPMGPQPPPQQAQVLAPALPGAPPMISIDTSPQALQAQGFQVAEGQQPPLRSALRAATQRNTTRRVGFNTQPPQQQQQQGPIASATRINVIKQG